jgi:alpha-tubulin suppressor-like RCC1 family protein
MAVNESNTIQYTIVTSRVTDGTVLYWKTTGNTTNSDITGGNTGTVTIVNNRALLNVAIAADANTDGTKTLGISILTGSLSGTPVINTASDIVINDTSLTPDNRLFSWGAENGAGGPPSIGSLGLNDATRRSSPTQVGSSSTWSQISNGGWSVMAINNGKLFTWGRSDKGFNGLNAGNSYKSSPTQVGALTNWSLVDTIKYTAAAVKTDGTLWLWGYNYRGELGTNDRVDKSSPVQIGTGTSWSSVSVGGSGVPSSFAIKTDGTLWAWGNNYFGNLGINTSSGYRSSPVQIGTGTTWSKVFAVDTDSLTAQTFAIKTDGTLWAWGNNSGGRLGINNAFNQSSPTQIGSNTWSNVAGRGSGTFGIKANGTLWAWGSHNRGTSGSGQESFDSSSPVQIGTLTNWSKIDVGEYHAAATKTDGTLWLWGAGTYGQLGRNDRVYRSSPVQVGTGTWSQVSVSKYYVFNQCTIAITQ